MEPNRTRPNPYRVELPSIISFSGGRSSGFMLYNILEAYDGKLPDEIKVLFCNTGLEHHATYDFVHKIEQEWCEVIWLEHCLDNEKNHSFRVVDYESSNRTGKPFDQVIDKRGFLPRAMMRFCTGELKIKTQKKYYKSLGWHEKEFFTHCVGLRADEPRRVAKIKHNKDSLKMEEMICPMSDAGHIEEDVLNFWKNYSFDLNLPLDSNIFGNCVGCFLKSYGKLEAIAREEPEWMDWWISQEERMEQPFRIDRPDYKTIKRDAHKQIAFDFGDTIDCHCTD